MLFNSHAMLEYPLKFLFWNERAWLALRYNFFQNPCSTSKFSLSVSSFEAMTWWKAELWGRCKRWLLSPLKRLLQITFWFVRSYSLLHVHPKLRISWVAARYPIVWSQISSGRLQNSFSPLSAMLCLSCLDLMLLQTGNERERVI